VPKTSSRCVIGSFEALTESALLRRFAPDYHVVTAGSTDAALVLLQGLAHAASRWR
jgi:hypothetical protein